MMAKVRVRRDSDGVWFARPYLGTNAITGKPLRPYRRFPDAGSEPEAQRMAEEWARTVAPYSKLGISTRLVEALWRYVAHLERMGAPANTTKTYRSLVRCYVEPFVGDVDVVDVRPYMLSAVYDMCLAEGGRRGAGISPNKVIQLHMFLRGAWKWMVAEELTSDNPVLSVRPPESVPSERPSLSEQDFAVLSEALARLLSEEASTEQAIVLRNQAMAMHLALWNAEREGEVCANVRSDASLVARSMLVSATAVEADGRVIRQPKTKGRRARSIAMDGAVCEAIARHYDWQRSYLSEYRQRSPATPICTTARGGLLRPSKLSAAFRRLADDLGLPKGIVLHSLRHTQATWMLMAGANLKDVQERLGHASEGTTLSTYVHMLPGRDREAVRIFGEAARRATGGGAGP